MKTETAQALVDRGVVTILPDGRLRMTAKAWLSMTCYPFLHFVGFKDDRYHSAVAVWGKPDFYHRFWDHRAIGDIAPGDKVVFADGDEHSPAKFHSFDDSANQ